MTDKKIINKKWKEKIILKQMNLRRFFFWLLLLSFFQIEFYFQMRLQKSYNENEIRENLIVFTKEYLNFKASTMVFLRLISPIGWCRQIRWLSCRWFLPCRRSTRHHRQSSFQLCAPSCRCFPTRMCVEWFQRWLSSRESTMGSCSGWWLTSRTDRRHSLASVCGSYRRKPSPCLWCERGS